MTHTNVVCFAFVCFAYEQINNKFNFLMLHNIYCILMVKFIAFNCTRLTITIL